MKRKLFFLALVIALALVSIALSRLGSAGAGLDPTVAPPEATTLSGGRYQLTGVTLRDTQSNAWQESDLSSGSGYHLKRLASPQLDGNGCCCLYLPCVRR